MSQHSAHKTDSSPRAILLCAAIFVAILLLAVVIMATSNQFDPAEMFKAAVDNIFIVHYTNFNAFQTGSIEGANIVTSFELLALAALIITVFIFAFFLNVLMPRWRLATLKALTVSWLMAFIVFSCLVQIKRAQALGDFQKQFASLKPEERIANLIGMPYVFADQCGQKLKKELNIEYISGVPPTKDPYMTQQRGLSYYFYPKVSVRIPRDGERVGNLYFYKQDALRLIPQDHKIACQSKDLNFILTVRKDKYDEYVVH